MTGAAIIRCEAGDAIVLTVHGAFDGASAWALRLEMEASSADRFVVDLTHAEETCDFAAGILAAFARQRWRDKRIAFRPGSSAHARLLSGHGLDVMDDDEPLDPELPSVATWPAEPPAAA